MTFMRRAVMAVSASALVIGTAAVPAQAQAVTGEEFQSRLQVALEQANKLPRGKAMEVDFSVSATMPDGSISKTTMKTVENANGSYITRGSMGGLTFENRCATKTKCFATSDAGKTWTQVKGLPNPVSIGIVTNASGDVPEGATFDITGNTYSMTDGDTTVVVIVDDEGVVMTTDGTGKSGARTTGTYEQRVVDAVKVKAPKKSKIVATVGGSVR